MYTYTTEGCLSYTYIVYAYTNKINKQGFINHDNRYETSYKQLVSLLMGQSGYIYRASRVAIFLWVNTNRIAVYGVWFFVYLLRILTSCVIKSYSRQSFFLERFRFYSRIIPYRFLHLGMYPIQVYRPCMCRYPKIPHVVCSYITEVLLRRQRCANTGVAGVLSADANINHVGPSGE